ncbi:CGNR zinc finger domain-containing protein [Inquilinus limosus]|uniref:CGNR zinc finger domain-containing protein n=1 Tax=Inquilinus limosus TaxID=171674 RepID=UPI0004285322|nr:ABATE domain-containing protein [Inquilinus limosus]
MAGTGGSRSQEAKAEELCIRFVNTMAWRLRRPQEERLPTPEALLRWLGANGLAEEAQLARIAPDRAAELHAAALALREAIYGAFRALIAGAAPAAEDLAVLNARLAGPGAELVPEGGGVAWRPGPAGPPGLLRPIALSAAALLTGPRAGRVRQCQDAQGCGWLFIDESRAQNRRWCSMGDCGNRAKASRHRARLRARA